MSDFLSIALVRIGRMRVAFPSESVECIVRGPIELGPFPQAPRHVLGAFNHRGAALPCIDLAGVIRPEVERDDLRPVAYALVLRCRGGKLAVQVDEILGVLRVEPHLITRLHTEHNALFQEIYTPPTGAQPAPLLDLDSLAALDGVRVATASDSSRASDDCAAGHKGSGTHQVVFRIGQLEFALPVSAVRLVESYHSQLDCAFGAGLVGGFHRFRQIDCPVADLAGALGIVSSQPKCVVVAEHNDRIAAFPVDAMVAVESITANRIGIVSEHFGTDASVFLGTVQRDTRTSFLILDPASLLERLGAPVATSAQDGTEQAAATEERPSFLVYMAAGGALATALTSLGAVFPLPKDFNLLPTNGSLLAGVCNHHGQSHHLVSVAALLGRKARGFSPGTPVLSVPTGSQPIGFVVDTVEFLHTASPRPLPSGPLMTPSGVELQSTILARSDYRTHTACVLDLQIIARRLATQFERNPV